MAGLMALHEKVFVRLPHLGASHPSLRAGQVAFELSMSRGSTRRQQPADQPTMQLATPKPEGRIRMSPDVSQMSAIRPPRLMVAMAKPHQA